MNKIVKYYHNNNFILLISFYFLLILGFFFGLDPNSGAYSDYQVHKRISQEFSENFFFEFLNYDQESTRHSPVLLIIFSFFEKLNFNDYLIRIVSLHFCLLLPLFFYEIIKFKFKTLEKEKLIPLSCLIFISPTFISLSIWPDSRIYGVIFFALSILFYLKFEQDRKFSNAIKCTIFYTISAYFSLNFSLFAIFFVLKFFNHYNFKKETIYLIIFNIIFALPALTYTFSLDSIFFLKSGIAGKEFALKDNLNYANKILIIPTIIIFYLIPFYLSKIIKFKKFDTKKLLISASIVLTCSFFFNYDPNHSGGGFIFKFSRLFIDNNIIFYILSTFSIYVLLEFCHKNFFNSLIISLLIVSNLQYSIYHKYYDPLLLILFFSIFDIKLSNKIIKKINLTYFYLFSLTFLGLNFLKQSI